MLIFIIILLIVTSVLCKKDYTGYTLFRILPSEGDNLVPLRKILADNNVDVWGLPKSEEGNQTIMIPPNLIDDVKNTLKSEGTNYYILTDNVQSWIDNLYKENPPDSKWDIITHDFSLHVYHTFEAISAHMNYIERQFPLLTEVRNIGRTFERNPLKLLKIGVRNVTHPKPAIWIDSGIHAREWITPATTLYIIDRLLKSSHPEIQQLLKTFDWYILPVINPDGYKYTWSHDRLWRKNRAPTVSNSSCRGTDLNRNFDIAFGDSQGANEDPCSEKYHGPSAFSEFETRTIRDEISKLQKSLKACITLHNYSQLLMSPYGFTRDVLPPDHEAHMEALGIIQSAIRDTHGQHYTTGTISNTIYYASGSSTDWVYAKGKIKYSFAFEMRDTGQEGFLISNTQITPNAEEIFAGIKAFANLLSARL